MENITIAMQNQSKILKALLEISRSITSEKLDDLLSLILKKALELTPATAGDIRLLDKAGKELEICKTEGKEVAGLLKKTKISEGVTGWVAREKKYAIVPDVSKDKRYKKCLEGTKSELAVPMLYEDRVIGVLNLESPEKGAFDKINIEPIEAIASQAGIAIENAKRIKQQQNIRLEVFYRIGSKITTEPERGPVLKEITKGVYDIVEADIPLIYLYDQEKAKFSEKIVFGDISKEWEGGCRPRQNGSGMEAIKRKKVVFARGEKVNPFARGKGVEITAAVPLFFNANSLAVLYMHFLEDAFSKSEEKNIGEDFLELSKRLSDIIGKFKFHKVPQSRVEKIKEDLADKIAKSKIIDALGGIADADIFLIYLCDPKEKKLNVIFAELSRSWMECRPRPNGAGEKAINGKKKKLIIAPDRDNKLDINPFAERKGVKTTAAYPLRLKDKILGVLYMHFLEKHRFTDDEERAIEMFAAHAATVIEMTNLNQSLRKNLDTLDAMQQIGKNIMSNLSLREVAFNIAKEIGKISEVVPPEKNIINLYLYDPEDITKSKFLACTRHPREREFGDIKIRRDGVGAKVVKKVKNNEEKQYVIVPTEKEGSPSARKLEAKTTACFPLKLKINSQTRIVALLYLHILIPHEFTDEEIQNYIWLSDQAAIAIEAAIATENAKKFEESEKKLGETYEDLFGTKLLECVEELEETIMKTEDKGGETERE